ncbi:MAG UNVERIFIED_CONTAM: hypothetical protein LVR18_19945 [Planctomycetaceae bacterium]|jgi:hypothetical protein
MEINVPFRLTADRDGKITGSSPQTPPIRVKLTKATVRTRTGCNSRSHTARATFEGGVTYDSGPKTLRDCQDLVVPLDLIAPGNVTTTLKFIVDGFNVGEVVEMIGTFEYTPFFGFRVAEELEFADYAMLPGLKNVTELASPIPPDQMAVLRVNACKSLIYLWFARFDVRQMEIGDEIASLLADAPVSSIPGRHTSLEERVPALVCRTLPTRPRRLSRNLNGLHRVGTRNSDSPPQAHIARCTSEQKTCVSAI